jgi:putative Mg2+ transporter-C (MgtC) family protein
MTDWLKTALTEVHLPATTLVVRLVFAIVLGGVIGFEREMRDKPAGFRTIILITLGACLFTVLSEIMGAPDYDTTRIAAQVVTGIGFLGAGSILRDRKAVFGMTTAATIWAVAAIGMACGFGELGLATAGTIACLTALFLFDGIERTVGRLRDIQEYRILTANSNHPFQRLEQLFNDARLRIRKKQVHEQEDHLVFHIVAMGSKARHECLRQALAHSPEYTLKPTF